ncbi:MAG: transcriptional repressor [Bacillota bacterium]|nr:transcriptional repressor [Bacillota bacterium]
METVRRTSKKRQAIYDALCATKSHPSAEQLYMELKNQIPDLSLGTVYRNLGVLMQDGLIISVGNVDGQERYDANTAPHAHFICTSCGKVDDADMELPLPGYGAFEEHTGWKLFSHSLSFSGKCCDCLERSQDLPNKFINY